MPKWEVLERESTTTPWLPVRNEKVLSRYGTREEAMVAAKRYVTERNVDNALASSEKEASADVFLMDDEGCYLGHLDGKPWYMRQKKDVVSKIDKSKILFKKGDVIKDANYFELDRKGEICVKEVPRS
jgi:hypothetical protein